MQTDQTIDWRMRFVGRQLSLYVFVAVLIAAGAVCGLLLVQALTLQQQEQLLGELLYYGQLLQTDLAPDAGQSFWTRVWFHTNWQLLIWLLGLSVAGIPFVLLLDFLKGVLIGFSFGLLVLQQSWQGLVFGLAALVPSNVLLVPALLIGSVSALSFAGYVVRYRLVAGSGKLGGPAARHTAICVVLLAVVWAAAWVEAYVSPLLIGWAVRLLL